MTNILILSAALLSGYILTFTVAAPFPHVDSQTRRGYYPPAKKTRIRNSGS